MFYQPQTTTGFNMSKNIKTVFEEHCSHLVFDKRLLTKLQKYERDFVHKSEDHIKFFGGNLLGVDPVRFTSSDQARWFDEILESDEGALKIDLHALPDVLPHRHVSSNVMNLSCFWIAHKFLQSSRLSQSDRELGAKLSILVLHYKFITSILSHWFKFKADPVVAQAAYDALTKRFHVKVAGSWSVLLEDRSETTVSRQGLHYRTLMDMTNDLDTIYMVNDTQNRVKSHLKHYMDVFTKVRGDERALVKNISGTINLDGDVKVRDRTRHTTNYVRYMESIVPDRSSFIIPQLVTIISSVISTAPKNNIEETLEYMSENFSVKADKDVVKLPSLILEHAFDYITKNPGVMASGNDVLGLLAKMRSVYQASKASDPLILEARKVGEKVAQRATKSRNKILLSALRNALMLYILLRAFTMDHFK